MKPELGDNINFLAKKRNAFSRNMNQLPANGVLQVPRIFSFTDNQAESFLFLKQLFMALYQDRHESIELDYKHCIRIDVDASACIDVILSEFVDYYRRCQRANFPFMCKRIQPTNFDHEEVKKVLFSIGAFKTIAGVNIPFTDIEPFPLVKGDNFSKRKGRDKELEVTHMVDYIIKCLTRMNRTLTWEAEDDLSKVIGEVLINAAEHSGQKYRYAIGYFQETRNDLEHLGIFNLTIFGFGNTIYENFKKPSSKDLEVVGRMGELSKNYTSRNWFKNSKFEEETLWTLYSLQEGVTSIRDKKRGNGSIRFIESFFRLKGDMSHDQSSSLTIISGNTRIQFDGKYDIKEVSRGKEGNKYKMMTFNESGNIEDKPDQKYCNFVDNFFPGTMIAAKISITFKNTEQEELQC